MAILLAVFISVSRSYMYNVKLQSLLAFHSKKSNEMYEARLKMLTTFIQRSMFHNCKSMVTLPIMKFPLVLKVVRYLTAFVMFRQV